MTGNFIQFAVFFVQPLRDVEKHAVHLRLLAHVVIAFRAVIGVVHVQLYGLKRRNGAGERTLRLCVRAVPRRIARIGVRPAHAVVRRVGLAFGQQLHARDAVFPPVAVYALRDRLPVVAAHLIHDAVFVEQLRVVAAALVTEYNVEFVLLLGLALRIPRNGELHFVQHAVRVDVQRLRVVYVNVQPVIVPQVRRIAVAVFGKIYELDAAVFVVRVVRQVEGVAVGVRTCRQIVQHARLVKGKFLDFLRRECCGE